MTCDYLFFSQKVLQRYLLFLFCQCNCKKLSYCLFPGVDLSDSDEEEEEEEQMNNDSKSGGIYQQHWLSNTIDYMQREEKILQLKNELHRRLGKLRVSAHVTYLS